MKGEKMKAHTQNIICFCMFFLLCGLKCFKKELGWKDADILLDQFQIKGVSPLVLVRNAFNNVLQNQTP